MNDKKRYYWLKLKKDFFQQHQIKVLKSLPNGRLYALIYLELLAESTSHEGELRYSQLLPYDTVTLASVIDEDKDNLEKAIETLIKLELVEVLDDGTIFMREIDRLIGSETGSAQRKRDYRERLNTIENVPQISNGTLSQNCPIENRDKSKENRDKRFIKPTFEEVRDYCLSRNNGVDPKRWFSFYEANGWMVGKNNHMKDWKAAIRYWERNTEKPVEETVPTYDSSSNKKMSSDEEDELLKLMGRK